MHPHLLSRFWGDSQAHRIDPALYFGVSLPKKISALTSPADPDLGAFHFIKRPWLLRPEMA